MLFKLHEQQEYLLMKFFVIKHDKLTSNKFFTQNLEHIWQISKNTINFLSSKMS